uniref:Uncharacterized protein n=1 Tax=Ditylenchus dipsaci TaxID=166011 RepID=A0A915EDT3_9BILA
MSSNYETFFSKWPVLTVKRWRGQKLGAFLSAPFFRFTPQLESEVPLDTTDDETLVRLLWTSKIYVNSPACQIEIQSLVIF